MIDDVLDSSGVGLFILDADFKVVWINHALEHYFGLSRQQIIGQDKRKYIRENIKSIFEDPEGFARTVTATYDDNTYVEKFECHVLAGDNREERWLEHWSQPIRSGPHAGGRIEHYTDITDRKQAEEQLRREKELAQNYLDIAGTMIAAIDADEKITLINRDGCEILGYQHEELLGQNWFDLLVPEAIRDEVRGVFKKLMAGDVEPIKHYENLLLTKDGEQRIVAFHNTIVTDSQDRIVGSLLSGNDITDRKQAEQERVLLEQQLFQAQKLEALGTLAGGVAHDFNNMLTGMIGMTELALRHLEPGTKAYEWLVGVPEQGKRAGELIASLMAFGRRTVTELRPLTLVPLVKELGKMLTRTMPENIMVRTAWPEQVPLVRADPTQMQQVIMNLATNARDAMPDGGELTIQVSEACLDEYYCRYHADATPGDYVCLSVRDTGTGISPEVREHIFEPFFTTKDVGDGTGLGLAMVYGIVKNHDGHVHFYSEVGRGTEFKIYLPAVKREPLAEEQGALGKLPEGTETLLLVEDDAVVLAVGQGILESLGYTVLTAADGEEGLDTYRAHHDEIALVLTDHTMPKMNGDKLYEAMVQIVPAVKVLVASGYACDQEISDLQARGLKGFVQKPFNSRDLGNAVRQAID